MHMRNGVIDTAQHAEFDFDSFHRRAASVKGGADRARTWLLNFAAPGSISSSERREEVPLPRAHAEYFSGKMEHKH